MEEVSSSVKFRPDASGIANHCACKLTSRTPQTACSAALARAHFWQNTSPHSRVRIRLGQRIATVQNAVLEGENEMALVVNHRIALERDRSERRVLEVTGETKRRLQATRGDLISIIRHHRQFCAVSSCSPN